MKRHIIWLIVGLLIFSLLLVGVRALDSRITMPLLGGQTTPDTPQQGDGDDLDNGASVPDVATADSAAIAAALIDAIGSPVTLDSAYGIAEARNMYDSLTPEAQALVPNLDALEAAERELLALESQQSPDPAPASGADISVGDIVTFSGGGVYVSPSAAQPSVTITDPSSCTVTYTAENQAHPYHIVSNDGGGVYGWVDASGVSLD